MNYIQNNVMRVIFIVALLIFGLPNVFSQKEIFLREMDFKLAKLKPNDYENEYFVTLNFNKGSNYKFSVLNNIDGLLGNAIVQILEADKLIATNSLGDKYFENFMFQCNKTGFYDILIHFENQKTGHSVIKLFLNQ